MKLAAKHSKDLVGYEGLFDAVRRYGDFAEELILNGLADERCPIPEHPDCVALRTPVLERYPEADSDIVSLLDEYGMRSFAIGVAVGLRMRGILEE
jgi:hypothetical protein